MKRAILLGLFVILLVSFVNAETIDVDFTQETTFGVIVTYGDLVNLGMYDDIHVFYLDEIFDHGGVRFKFVPFSSNNTDAQGAYASLDAVSVIDLDRDGESDINVAIYSVDEDDKVTMIFQEISESNGLTGDATGVVDENSNKTIFLIVLGVIVVILLIILLFRNFGSNKEEVEEAPKNEEKSEEKPSEEDSKKDELKEE